MFFLTDDIRAKTDADDDAPADKGKGKGKSTEVTEEEKEAVANEPNPEEEEDLDELIVTGTRRSRRKIDYSQVSFLRYVCKIELMVALARSVGEGRPRP